LAASPGGLISIFGAALAASEQRATVDAQGKIPSVLGGASVRIGVLDAPLLYVSPEQINAQIPFEMTPGTYPLTVTTALGTSAPMSLRVTSTSPGVFVVARNADNSIVGANGAVSPVKIGDVLVIYATGLGAVTPQVPSGQLAPVNPIANTSAKPIVTIGGQTAQVVNSVLSPNFVGLYQIGIVVPSGVALGLQTLMINVAGNTASAGTLNVTSANGCADISGAWQVSETAKITITDTAAGVTESGSEDGKGSGTVNIIQDGCSVSYTPPGISSLTSGQLSAEQAAAFRRTGTVSGNTVVFKGILALVDVVAANVAGVVISENHAEFSGTLLNGTITLSGTGRLIASGNVPGLGAVTETWDAVSTAMFKK
jgi:uncharacterized protein (TIGR03437 family)